MKMTEEEIEQWIEEKASGFDGAGYYVVNSIAVRELHKQLTASKEWSGEGQPPVGTHCEATWGTKEEWCECFICPDGKFVFKNRLGKWTEPHTYEDVEFHPLHNDKEKVIEAAIKKLPYKLDVVGDEHAVRKMLERIYDFGMLRNKDGEE